MLTLAFRFNRWLVNPKMMSASTKNVPKSIRLGFWLSAPDDPLEFCKSIVQLWLYFLALLTVNVQKSSPRSKSFYRWFSLIPKQCHGLIQRVPLRYIQLLTHLDRPVSVPNYLPRIKSYIQMLTLVKALKNPIQSIHDPCASGIHPWIGSPRLVLSTLQVKEWTRSSLLRTTLNNSTSFSLPLPLSLSALTSSWLLWSLSRLMLNQCALLDAISCVRCKWRVFFIADKAA